MIFFADLKNKCPFSQQLVSGSPCLSSVCQTNTTASGYFGITTLSYECFLVARAHCARYPADSGCVALPNRVPCLTPTLAPGTSTWPCQMGACLSGPNISLACCELYAVHCAIDPSHDECTGNVLLLCPTVARRLVCRRALFFFFFFFEFFFS